MKKAIFLPKNFDISKKKCIFAVEKELKYIMGPSWTYVCFFSFSYLWIVHVGGSSVIV